jgi:hypothetical protein
MDTQELYALNLKTRKDELAKFGWIDNKVSYTFNEHGFRCPSFEDKPSIMFLGCSHTMGIGINIEDTWAHLTSKELKLHCINLSQGGGANDTAFRLGSHWIPRLKPKIVFLLQPDSSRLEIISSDDDIQFLMTGLEPPKRWKRWYYDWISSDSNKLLNLQKNTLALAQICRSNGIKFLHISADELLECDKARDLAHVGAMSNRHFVGSVLSLIHDTDAV